MKIKLIDVILVLLTVIAIWLNYLDKYKAIGIGCIVLMGILGVIKGKIYKKN